MLENSPNKMGTYGEQNETCKTYARCTLMDFALDSTGGYADLNLENGFQYPGLTP